VGSLTILLVMLEIYLTRKLHPAPNEAIGFDPVSLLGRHYQIVLPPSPSGFLCWASQEAIGSCESGSPADGRCGPTLLSDKRGLDSAARHV